MAEAVMSALSILTVAAQAYIAAIIIAYGLRTRVSFARRFLLLSAPHGLRVAFAAALIATVGSLFFSEIAGYSPCTLCWYQRIAMYPNVLLLGMALVIRDRNVAAYSAALSAIGAIIAGFHYFLQLSALSATSCAAVGYSVSCSDSFMLHFGYITIPMMTLSAFLLIIISCVAHHAFLRRSGQRSLF